MLALLSVLTPSRRTEFIHCPKAKVPMAVVPNIDVKTQWNLTLELLERAYQLLEFSCHWLKIPKYSDYQPLFSNSSAKVIYNT